jgi:hypothetical protein
MTKKIKKGRNLNDMLSQLQGVELSVNDIEQLALQVIMESETTFNKVAALKLLVEIKKHLSTDKNEKELLDILKGE